MGFFSKAKDLYKANREYNEMKSTGRRYKGSSTIVSEERSLRDKDLKELRAERQKILDRRKAERFRDEIERDRKEQSSFYKRQKAASERSAKVRSNASKALDRFAVSGKGERELKGRELKGNKPTKFQFGGL